MEEQEIKFEEELYQKNLQENDFSQKETDGVGGEENANN